MREIEERVEALRDALIEPVAAEESETLARLTRACRAIVDASQAKGLARRAAHPKVHAFLYGAFSISPELPSDWRQGVFSEPGKRYEVRARLSSTSPTLGSDAKPDVIGLAFKLLDVAGERLLPVGQPTTQDFLLVSASSFFTSTPATFAKMLQATARGSVSLLWFFLRHPAVVLRFLRGLWESRKAPFDAPFFSQTAYALGHRPVQWEARALLDAQALDILSTLQEEARALDADHRLHYTLRAWLRAYDLSFAVYARAMGPDDSVDQATRPYAGERVRLGTLHLPAQDFARRDWMQLGERMAFSPWQGVVAHRPMGVFGRARAVYVAAERYRRELRGDGAPTTAEQLSQMPKDSDPEYVPPAL